MSNNDSPLLTLFAKMNEDLALRQSFSDILANRGSAADLVKLGERYNLTFTEQDVSDFGDVARAWTDTEYRGQLSADQLRAIPTPPGGYQLDGELLDSVVGGARTSHLRKKEREPPPAGSSGYLCTVSAECMGGKSCWPF